MCGYFDGGLSAMLGMLVFCKLEKFGDVSFRWIHVGLDWTLILLRRKVVTRGFVFGEHRMVGLLDLLFMVGLCSEWDEDIVLWFI